MQFEDIISTLIDLTVKFTLRVVLAIVIFIVGKWLINKLNNFVGNIMSKRKSDPSIMTFTRSFINISLLIMLLIVVVGTLGVETSSFVALFASAGVAIGMALSGNLQNFAGGVVILLFKPYKVGDYIVAQNMEGTVKEIQIFSTILTTGDNKTVIIPNGGLSTGAITNFSSQDRRRVEWVIGVEYGQDYDAAKSVIIDLLNADQRVLRDPAYMVALKELADSSVNIVIRAWVLPSEYWNVFFDMNEKIYKTFNEKGIGFPFPQLDVHLTSPAKEN
ncbi:MAG: mechanosensitive ion channel [Bacteroidales bacterium]|nr:mechanosensitive ion channel [Bacteroidales bacterium]